MSKIALALSANRQDASLSQHFGQTEWISIADTDAGSVNFFQPTESNGRCVAQLLAQQQCTDAIFTRIGEGALRHLLAANVRPWLAPAQTSGLEALRMLERGELTRVLEGSCGDHGSHGCCSAHAGHGGGCGCH